MARRLAACRPPRSNGAIAVESPPTTASRIWCCRSISNTTALLPADSGGDPVRSLRLCQQRGQGGNVVVPLDQRGRAPETTEGVRVQLPRRLRHAGRVCVDQYVVARRRVILHAREAAQMQLPNRLDRQTVEVRVRVVSHVVRAYMDVA